MTEKEFFRHCGILDKWYDLTFENFTNDPKTKQKVKKYLHDYVEWRKKGVGIYFFGANGVGKSLLMNCLFKEFIALRKRARIISMSDLVSMMVQGWKDDDIASEFEKLKRYYEYLGIEEISKEYRSFRSDMKGSDMVVTALDGVLRERMQRNLPTFFTSNMSPMEIGKAYSIDIASMLNEVCLIMEVTGEDYRDKIAEKNRIV